MTVFYGKMLEHMMEGSLVTRVTDQVAKMTGVSDFYGERVTKSILYPNLLQHIGILLGAARMLPDRVSEVAQQHYERYVFASEHVIGKNVLDIASGCGFGAEILKNAGAESVVGLDISLAAAQSASHDFGKSGNFAVADATLLPLSNDSFDVATSFETLEHVVAYRDLLGEISRVLKKDGSLILSTPNRQLSSPGTKLVDQPVNSYHTQEFDGDELMALLTEYFTDIEVYGQDWKEDILANGIATPLKRSFFEKIKYHGKNIFKYRDHALVSHQDGHESSSQPVYYIVVCKGPISSEVV